MREILEQAAASSQLRAIDVHGARWLDRLAVKSSPELLLAAALAGRAVGDGHICLPLDRTAGRPVFAGIPCIAPDSASWRERLLQSGVVGEPGGSEPLILDQASRLYLARYYRYEQVIAEHLLQRCRVVPPSDAQAAARFLSRLFPGSGSDDRQRSAAAMAAVNPFLAVSGGPGTGKTFTVARIVALLQAMAGRKLRIGLAAPTGRAAVRLHEAIVAARQQMDDDLRELVPHDTTTLHRLLGLMPETGRCRFNRDNRLHLDLLVIDEASMIDVPLMANLLQALPDQARLVMLGDHDQLTSVEAGSLFSDICAAGQGWSAPLCRQIEQLTGSSFPPGQEKPGFGDCIARLHAGYRFGGRSGIGRLALAVRQGDRQFLAGMQDSNIDLELLKWGPDQGDELADLLLREFAGCFSAAGPAEALKMLESFRVLCAVREGPAGVAGINSLAETVLRRRGVIRTSGPWYQGRPVMIRKNDYHLGLFNGDTGVIWPDDEGDQWAWFFRPDKSLLQVPLARLPQYDTAYAITVHQAQGSEYDRVLFLLPDRDSRVLSRELIYTAVTRARTRLTICGDHSLLLQSIDRRVERYSGLTDRLRGVFVQEMAEQ